MNFLKILSFWEANENKQSILKEISKISQEKLRHYQRRVEEILNRETYIYRNYEISKKLPKIEIATHGYFIKGNHSKSSKNLSLQMNKNVPNTERSFAHLSRKSRNLTEASPKSILNSSENCEDLKRLKKASISLTNLKKKVGNLMNFQSILKKRNLKFMNECEHRMEIATERFSELKCFEFLCAKLAPRGYEEMKKKIRIIHMIRKKNLK